MNNIKKIMCDLCKAPMGFEPMTSCLLDRRSNQLSYGALHLVKAYFLYFFKKVAVKEIVQKNSVHACSAKLQVICPLSLPVIS